MEQLKILTLLFVKGIFIFFCVTFTPVIQAEESLEDRVHGMDVKVIDDHYGSSFVLPTDDLFIAAGSTIIRPQIYTTLNRIAEILQEFCDVKVTVAGHTDNIYTKTQRMEISEKYAKSVASYLVQRGVDPEQIFAVRGYGSQLPIAINDSFDHRRMNRRVEVTLHAYDLP